MGTGLARDFWNGRRVFVTGHTGFKGGWLIALLEWLGAKGSGYALAPPSSPNLFEAARIAGLGVSHIGDIRDEARLAATMQAVEPDIVLHLAAQALVRPARANPIETFSTNVMGTAHVLEAVRRAPSVKTVVIVTSDKVYDNVEWPWAYREGDRLGGKEPYGASKACAEIVVEAYRHSYFSDPSRPVAVATARAGNVIGGGDWAEDRLVPDAMRAFSKNEALVVRNPAAVRPWQHVLEPLSGYLHLAEALSKGRLQNGSQATFNFGPHAEDAVPVATIADRLVARWGANAAWTQDARSHPYEARLLEVDSAAARARLRWAPRWRLETALDKTVDWYKGFYANADMRALTLSQIDEYLDA
jgi:CDP-glucose 4,6-dehydratase